MDKKEEAQIKSITLEVMRDKFRFIGLCQAIFLAVLISSPFAWMWWDWSYAWRIALTGLGGTLICKAIYSIVYNYLLKEAIRIVEKEKAEEKKSIRKTEFQKLLDEKMSEINGE